MSAVLTVLVAVLVVVLGGGGARTMVTPAATGTPGPPVPKTFTSADVGFSDGVPVETDLTQRLDAIAGYLPGRSPIVRADLDWQRVESCRGCRLDWSHIEPVVDGAAARGERILLILGYAPLWANGNHTDDPRAGVWFPTNDDDWTSIIARAVRHFGTKVQAYEVWNEPNNKRFGEYGGNTVQEVMVRYWQLVHLAHQAVHANCASCVVVAGPSSGLFTPDEDPAREPAVWLDWAYDHGYGKDFDALALHPYPDLQPDRPQCTKRWLSMFGPTAENPPCGELALVHSIMVKNGDTAKKIWATEWGYAMSHSSAPPLKVVADSLTWCVRAWRSLPYAGPLFLFSYHDAADQFGIVNATFAHKDPVYTDLQAAFLATPAGVYHLDGTHATTTADAVRLQNAALSGGAGWSKPGHTPGDPSALTLNGTTAAATTAGPVLHTNQSYTVIAWVKPIGTNRVQTVVSQSGTHTNAMRLGYGPNNNWIFQTASTDGANTGGTTISSPANSAVAGRWTFLAAVYAAGSGKMHLLVNGVLVASGTADAPFDARGSMTIGRDWANDAYRDYFHGQVDDVRLYQGALSQEEIANLATNGYAMGFQAKAGTLTVAHKNDRPGDMGMMAGTSPSIAAVTGGGWITAFQANTGKLWVVGTGGVGDTGLAMAAATSPSIAAVPSGGYYVAFQSNTGHLWVTGKGGASDTGLVMAPGTSPSIAAVPSGGYLVAYQSEAGMFATAGDGSDGETNLAMAAATSPSIAAVPSGGYYVAFQSNTGHLWVTGKGGASDTGLVMAPGTSPSIAAVPSGGYLVAYQSEAGMFATAGDGSGSETNLAMMARTSPSIAATLPGGGYVAAFQAKNGDLWTVGTGAVGDTHMPMQASTNPSIAALPTSR